MNRLIDSIQSYDINIIRYFLNVITFRNILADQNYTPGICKSMKRFLEKTSKALTITHHFQISHHCNYCFYPLNNIHHANRLIKLQTY